MSADGDEHCSSWLPELVTVGTGGLRTRCRAEESLPEPTEVGRRSTEDGVAWNGLERSPERSDGRRNSSGKKV